MLHKSVIAFFCFLLFGSIYAHEAGAGRIVVAADEHPLSDYAFELEGSSSEKFALNIASWFGGSPAPGKDFLVYSNNFGLTGDAFSGAMTTAGYGWDIVDPTSYPLPTLTQYKGVFVGGNAVDISALTAYVQGGGNIYFVI